MVAVSKFSTKENYDKLKNAEAELQLAQHEAELAVQAKLPGAEEVLAKTQAGMQQVQNLLNVYFPNGTAPTS